MEVPAAVQMIDTSIIRVHQRGTCISRNSSAHLVTGHTPGRRENAQFRWFRAGINF